MISNSDTDQLRFEKPAPPPGTGDGLEARPAAHAAVGDLLQRSKSLGPVAVDVAHEFSNLLTVVLGSLEQLRRQPLDDHGRRQLERADWSARQAARLTRQVLFPLSNAAEDDKRST